MKARRTLWLFLVLAAPLMMSAVLHAAEFSPALEAELALKSETDLVEAIVILESPIDIRALDDRLHVIKASREKRYREVMSALKYNAEQTQPAFKAELDEAIKDRQVVGYTAYWIENLFVIQATKQYLEGFRPRGDISYCTENFDAVLIDGVDNEPSVQHAKPAHNGHNGEPPITTLNVPPGIRAVGAYRVATELGITGQGVLVANCDTGVDGTHPALASRWRGNFAPAGECWRDALGSAPNFPADGNGHGTHVMGTITGRAIVGADTQWVGCAPNARWIATNSINQGVGSAFDNDIIADYQWFANPDGNINTMDDVPDVVQNSWRVNSGFSGYQTCDSRWNTVILNCEAGGTVVTWSAGNEGPGSQTMGTPPNFEFNAYQIFSVGAVDASAYPSAPYPIASFSSRGPTPCQPNPNAIKPEICAPGVNVYSSIPGGGYSGTYSGTSMAGPHVAGVVALMREACPDCDPQTIKAAIMSTAIDNGYPPAGEDNTHGAGFIDAYNAVLAVFNLGGIGGVVRDASSNPLSGVLVQNTGGSQQTTTNAGGQYFMPISAGTYTLRYSKFGYVTQDVPGITVVAGDTTVQDVVLQSVPTAPLYGYVYNPGNLPQPGAQVQAVGVPISPVFTNGSGYYTLNLPTGQTYTVRADAAGFGGDQYTIVFNGTMQQDFHLTDILLEDYETGNFTHFPWFLGGHQPWSLTTSGVYQGVYSARSGAILDNQFSEMSVSLNTTTSGPITFYYWVSSEIGYDFLVFLIDGMQQAEWSGTVGWTQASFNVTTGHHTFTWRYTKDGNTASGSDAVMVDYIIFPPSSVPAAVPLVACYDFEASDQGWVSGAPGDNATTGLWNRGNPEGSWNSDRPVQPEDDHTVAGVNCWASGTTYGGSLGANDIDGGKTTLLSPVWDLHTFDQAVLETYTWFSNDEGGSPDEDYFVISASSDGGTNWTDMLNTHFDWEYWRRDLFHLERYVALTNQVRVRIIGQDQVNPSLVEAGVDDVCLYAGSVQPPDPPTDLTIIPEGSNLHLRWVGSAGATGYIIKRATTSDGVYDTIGSVSGATFDWVHVNGATDPRAFYLVIATR